MAQNLPQIDPPPIIQDIPLAPSRLRPDDFNADAERFFPALPRVADEQNAALDWMRLTFDATDQARQMAADSAGAAASSAQSASADASKTAADRVQTGQDRSAAASSAQSASADASKTAADRVKTGQDRSAAQQAKQDAVAARDEAQSIVVGDFSITDLQPGPLNALRDYVSSNGNGGLVKRNLKDDVEELISGKRDLDDTDFKNYTLDTYSSSKWLYVSQYRVIRVTVTSNKTLQFLGAPPADKALTMVVYLYGVSLPTYAVSWPTEIHWSEGEAPVLDGTKATVVLFWTGSDWIGTLGALS